MANANTNEKPLTAEEKKDKAFKKLIEKGKASGHLTAQEIAPITAVSGSLKFHPR